MQIGQLDRRITIQVASVVPDGAGQEVETWTEVAVVWAHVVLARGSERFQSRQIIGKAVTTFRIRHRTDVTVENRIVYDGKTWDIHDVREVGRRISLELDATARSE